MRKSILYSILAAICFANLLWIMHLNSLYYLPPGDDPGHWLAHAKALVDGVKYPMWGEGLLQYPPIPLLLLGLFAKVFGDVLGMGLFGATVLALLPLSFFILVNRMFGPRVGIVASVFIAICPIFYDMWGWGGYPNLFGFSILFLALFTTINFMEQGNRRWAIGAGLMSIVLIFSHHLTSIVFIGTLLLWALLCFSTKQRTRELALITVVSLAVFGLYRVIVPPQFDIFNPNALFVLRMDYQKFLWVFKDISIFIAISLCTAYACYRMYKTKPSYFLAILSLIISTFALTYGLPVLRIVLDQARFLIFSLPAFIVGVTYLIQEIQFSATMKSFVTMKSLTIIIVVAALLSVNGYIGVRTSWEINKFYRWSAAGIETPSGDSDIRQMVDWIKTNTDEKDVFVAEHYLSKIIMGLGERRVLEATHPGYLFMQGEIGRSLAADSLLNSNYEIHHPFFRIRDQYPVQNHNPIIGLWERGYYHDIIYFADGFLQVELTKGGKQYLDSPYAVRTSEYEPPLSVTYLTPNVVFSRSIKIEEEGIQITFSAEPRGPDVTLLNMTIYGWRPWHNHNLRDIVIDESGLTLVDGEVDARIIVKNVTALDYYLADPIYKQAGFQAIFEPENNRITAEFLIPYKYHSEDLPEFFEAEKTIEKYGVSYFAVLNGAESQIWFLENNGYNGYNKAFKNSLVSIYRAKQE